MKKIIIFVLITLFSVKQYKKHLVKKNDMSNAEL